MDNLMVFLWAVVWYGTNGTPFNYSLPSGGELRIISGINMEFINFPAGGNNPAASPATSRQKRKQLPASDSNKNESHSIRSSNGTTSTISTTAMDNMGLPKTVIFASQGRKPRGKRRK